MKKMLFTAALLFRMLHTFSQPSLSPSRSREAYLHKSKNQKTIAWVLVAGSAALITYSYAAQNEGTYIQLPLAAGLFVASVPLFNAAARNKQKAKTAAVFLKYRKRSLVQPESTGFSPRMAVTVRIPL